MLELYQSWSGSATELSQLYNKTKPIDSVPRNHQSIVRQLKKLGKSQDRECLLCGSSFNGVLSYCSQSCRYKKYTLKAWEAEAIEYLQEIAGTDRVTELVAKFNRQAKLKGWEKRSHYAIFIKLTRTDTSIEPISTNWTASELARNLDIIRHRVHKWIKRGLLKTTKPKGRPEKGGKSKLYRIGLQDFRKFCNDYPHLLQGIDINLLATIYGANRADLPKMLERVKLACNNRGLAKQVMRVRDLKIFQSVSEAARQYKIDPNKIHRILDISGKVFVDTPRSEETGILKNTKP